MTPHNMQMPLGTYRGTEEYGDIWRVSEPPGGIQTPEEYKCMGIQIYGGIQMPLSIKHMPATKKSWKNLFKAKFLHLKNWKNY